MAGCGDGEGLLMMPDGANQSMEDTAQLKQSRQLPSLMIHQRSRVKYIHRQQEYVRDFDLQKTSP